MTKINRRSLCHIGYHGSFKLFCYNISELYLQTKFNITEYKVINIVSV
jgi:hypothetical protein